MSGAKRVYIQEYFKARESDRLKSSFLANMSHEVRTPLNAIVGFSNLLAEDDLEQEERQDYVSIINSSNQSLLRLINDILDVSLIETDQLKLVESTCNLKQMMLDLEKTYQLKLNELKKTTLKVKSKPALKDLLISTDCERLQQVMVNLLDNAIKYSEKGTIDFGYEMMEDSIRFYVRDTGIGIEEQHLAHLFDRFYKVEDKQEKLYRGTGIGLYLCKRIVELLGGKIEVNSKVGEGSEFYFYLHPKVLQRGVEGKRSNEPHESMDGLRQMKVLIVEDQLTNRQYLDAVLKSDRFELFHASNGKEGVALFHDNPEIQLVLMDIKMPEMDGYQALAEIRKINSKVPVFALTAHAMASDKDKCLQAGFNAYFSKPIDKKLLLQKINTEFH
jgi:two-component system CheB/CheR fusion protein